MQTEVATEWLPWLHTRVVMYGTLLVSKTPSVKCLVSLTMSCNFTRHCV